MGSRLLYAFFANRQLYCDWTFFYCLQSSLCPWCILEAWQLLLQELLPPFSPSRLIHLLIDSIISVEITVSEEIWELHHACLGRRQGGDGGWGGEARGGRKKKCYNSKGNLGIIWRGLLKKIQPPFPYRSFYHWKMMAVTQRTTSQGATAAVNHHTFISAINNPKNMYTVLYICVWVRLCVSVCPTGAFAHFLLSLQVWICHVYICTTNLR